MTLIGISGKRGAGKNSIADYLEHTYGFTAMAFADPLKRACREVFGFTHEQLYGTEKGIIDPFWGVTPGWVLQVVGTEAFRGTFGQRLALETGFAAESVWERAAERRTKAHFAQFPARGLVFSDLRFLNEAQMIVRLGGRLMRVERPGLAEPNDGRSASHESEVALDNWDRWDARIVNDGDLFALYAKVDAIMREWA